ncbi:MAG: hypothetical protein ACK55I_31825, partial [bacterium]
PGAPATRLAGLCDHRRTDTARAGTWSRFRAFLGVCPAAERPRLLTRLGVEHFLLLLRELARRRCDLLAERAGALHGRACTHRLEPALQVVRVIEALALQFVQR